MSLVSQLNDSLTKENGGRHGGKGHEFQRYWALNHLLEMDIHNLDDYLMVFEFVEDVAVLDSESTPSCMELFQLKKKEGVGAKWTKNLLSKPSKGNKSIIAKLHQSKVDVGHGFKSISFVSNAPVELGLIGGVSSIDCRKFSMISLDDKALNFLKKSVAVESGCSDADVDFKDFYFIKSPLAMDDLSNHAVGLVSTYLAKKNPGHNARADVFCEALYSEIKIKTTTTDVAIDFDSLKRMRGISRSQFCGMLLITLSKRSDFEILDEIIRSLTQVGVPYVRRESIKRATRRFFVEKSWKNVDLLIKLDKVINLQMDCIPPDLVSVWDVANWIAEKVVADNDCFKQPLFEAEYLLAVILYRLHV